MAKNIRRMLAMVLVMCMFVSALPMQALAAEGDELIPQTKTVTEGPITNENGDTVTTTTTTSTDNSGNTTVTVEIQTESPISNGNSTVTVETQTESSSTSGNTTVNSGENTSSTTVQYKDEEGEVVRTDKIAESSSSYTETNTSSESGTSSTYVEEGQEWSKESMDIPEGGVKLDIPLTEDDPSTEAEENVNSETFGDPAGTKEVIDGEKPSEGDTNYEYTETTVLEQGKVTVTTNNVTIQETIVDRVFDENGNVIAGTNLEHVRSETTPNDTNDLTDLPEKYGGPVDEAFQPGYDGDPVIPEGVPNYDYVYVGSGNVSKFVPAIVYDKPLSDDDKIAQFGNDAYIKDNSITYYYVGQLKEEDKARIAKDANGNYITDEDGFILDNEGNRIFKEERTEIGPNGETTYLHRFDNYVQGGALFVEGWYDSKTGEWVKELNGEESFGAIWAGPQQFVLVDSTTGQVITTYCADSTTPTEKSFGYNIENLEDADYYSDEEAEHIRSIALNGYWGTVGTEIDENGQEVPKLGSLEDMKATLKAAGFSDTELASLNDGVALTATQMAIWTYSNKMSGTQFINAHYSNWGADGTLPTEKEDEVKLMFKIYDYLINLDPTPAAPEEEEVNTENTVINADNFLQSMDITVVEKDETHANNSDAYDDNDAYVTKLTFSLAVVPARDVDGNLNENDDLVVILRDKNGKVMATGRIAGDMKDDEIDMRGVKDNNYSFENITMVEGGQKFTLNLSGIQHLKEGVYLYSSEVRTVEDEKVSSQTLVGLAGGNHGVNVTMDIEFNLNVEDEVMATERVWHYEHDPVITPPAPPAEPVTPPTPPTPPAPVALAARAAVWTAPENQRLANEEAVEIPEEPVPLATPAITGDDTGLWVMALMMIACCMVAINVFDKKRNHEAF